MREGGGITGLGKGLFIKPYGIFVSLTREGAATCVEVLEVRLPCVPIVRYARSVEDSG